MRAVVIADVPLARMKRLLGKKKLGRGEGIVLRPAASVNALSDRLAAETRRQAHPAGMPIPIKHLERIRAGKTGPCGGNVRGATTPLEVS